MGECSPSVIILRSSPLLGQRLVEMEGAHSEFPKLHSLSAQRLALKRDGSAGGEAQLVKTGSQSTFV